MRLWDVATGAARRTLIDHQGKVLSVAFSADGHTCASGGNDGKLILWDTRTGAKKLVHEPGKHIWSIVPAPGGRWAFGANDGTVNLFDPDHPDRSVVLPGHQGGVRSIAFTSDGKTLASGGIDKTVILWHVATGQRLRTLTPETGDQVNGVAFSPDGRTLAAASHDGSLRLWSADAGVGFGGWAK